MGSGCGSALAGWPCLQALSQPPHCVLATCMSSAGRLALRTRHAALHCCSASSCRPSCSWVRLAACFAPAMHTSIGGSVASSTLSNASMWDVPCSPRLSNAYRCINACAALRSASATSMSCAGSCALLTRNAQRQIGAKTTKQISAPSLHGNVASQARRERFVSQAFRLGSFDIAGIILAAKLESTV